MDLAPEHPGLRKARGAFFTPPDMADYVTEWAVRRASDQILEPSCGEAAFLLAAARRLRDLGAEAPFLHGHELHEPSARAAASLLRSEGYDAEIGVGDFFAEAPTERYDAVIGNPPYVRYQEFSGAARALSRRAALRDARRRLGQLDRRETPRRSRTSSTTALPGRPGGYRSRSRRRRPAACTTGRSTWTGSASSSSTRSKRTTS